MNLIDHLDHDHIPFAGGGSPNLLVLVYLVEKVQEVGACFSNKVLAQRIQSSDTDLTQVDLYIADIKD